MNKLQVTMAAQLLAKAYEQVARKLLRDMPAGCQRVKGVPTYAEAPSTLLEMCDCISDNNGVMFVAQEGCANSIYGHTGNMWFRAMHDLGHLTFDKDTTYEDECELAMILWPLIADELPADYWYDCAQVYIADTIGQSMYCDEHGVFPADQIAFVQAVCRNEVHGVGPDAYRAHVLAALPPKNEVVEYKPKWMLDIDDMLVFANCLHKHNVAVRRVAETRRRLALAANRFMRRPAYPYGEQAYAGR